MNSATISPPVIPVTVRQGMVQDVDCTIPALVVIEDWDCREWDTDTFPSRNIDQAGSLSQDRAEKYRALMAEGGDGSAVSPESGGQP